MIVKSDGRNRLSEYKIISGVSLHTRGLLLCSVVKHLRYSGRMPKLFRSNFGLAPTKYRGNRRCVLRLWTVIFMPMKFNWRGKNECQLQISSGVTGPDKYQGSIKHSAIRFPHQTNVPTLPPGNCGDIHLFLNRILKAVVAVLSLKTIRTFFPSGLRNAAL